MRVSKELQKHLQPMLPPGHTLASIQKMFGEASYREYFRIKTMEGRTYVLMKIPAGLQSVSEEITNYQGPKDELPFLNIAKYLQTHDLPIPELIATDLKQGLILLKDLGDRSLEKLLANCNETMRLFFYKQAVDLLLRLQITGEKYRDPDCMAFRRSFDLNLLMWEFEHFLEYGIEDRFSLKIPQASRAKILKLGQELTRPITKIPYGLTHRDFQSRNLLFYGYEFYLIDFQDALLGPPHYDLVALLRDSYVEMPPQTVEFLLDYYLEGRKKIGLSELEPREFRNNFYRVTLQRKLKDAGRFQFIHTVKKNSSFLAHLPTSLSYVNHAFNQLPQFQPLKALLAEYVPELQ